VSLIKHWPMSRRVAITLLFIAALAAFVTRVGFAASLPVTSDSLFAQLTADVPNVAIVDDDFVGNGNLDARVPSVAPPGAAWLVEAGSFTTQTGDAESKGNAVSRATIETGVSDGYTASTEITSLGTADYAGIVFLASGGTYMYAVYNGVTDQAELYTSASGTPVATSTSLGSPATFTISVQVDQPTITVRIGGSPVIVYAMPSGISLTRAGIIAESRGTIFEQFTVVAS
jgi:hypothetical protein